MLRGDPGVEGGADRRLLQSRRRAQGDRITLAANTEGGPFGLSPDSLLGLPNSFAIQNILMSAMGEKGERGR